MSSRSSSSDGGWEVSAAGASRGAKILIFLTCLISALSSGCGRTAASREPVAGVRNGGKNGPGDRSLRIVVPSRSPRVPFFLDLKADMIDPDTCEILLSLRSHEGGPARVEFVLPEGILLAEGELVREDGLEAGELKIHRLVVKVPRDGHRTIGAQATVGEKRAEAFLEFGERPTAEERGFSVRTREKGDRILRFSKEMD